MANKSLFQSVKSLLPRADARNEEGASAYKLPPKQALAQIAATGCFNGTFYAQATAQLDAVSALVAEIDDNLFLAKLVVYAREKGLMKDMPAALLVLLSKRDPAHARKVFGRVVDNGAEALVRGKAGHLLLPNPPAVKIESGRKNRAAIEKVDEQPFAVARD
jgi:60 kDa SS-A/Ro ribonucleoprotein